jgi:cytochrome oxidase Cu insertion factor (SCO1/SenC/PrrC family)
MTRFVLLLGMMLTVSAWGHGTDHPQSAKAQGEAVVSVASRGATKDPRAYFGDSELISQDGRKLRFYSDVLRDRVVVVNVIYTSCKDACPLITSALNQVKAQLGDLFGSRVFFVSISSDPERDTPRALKKFAQAQHADVEGWTFLTGSKDSIDHVLGKLGQLSQSAEEHSTLLLLLDVDAKRMRKVLPHLPAQLIAEHVRQVASAEKAPAPPAGPKLK